MRKVLAIGLDGLEPGIVDPMLAAGELPNLERIRRRGTYARLATTTPAQTPVAWSSFATGTNPGGHGIFDFVCRDPASYRPDVALFRFEPGTGFRPPRAVGGRGGTPFWEILSAAGVPCVILRHPCTFPAERVRGRLLAGVGVPDLRGSFGSGTYWTAAGTEPQLEGERVVLLEGGGSEATLTHLPGPRDPKSGAETRFELDVRPDPAARTVEIRSEGTPDRLVVREREWSDWLRVKFRFGPLQASRGIVRFHLGCCEPLRLYASPINYDPEAPSFPISHPWGYAADLRRELGPYHTLGMAEDHTGLNNGRLDEDAFLSQCADVLAERRAMMRRELRGFSAGFFYCLFDTPDRVQHMLWRFREPDHPANRGLPGRPELSGAIEAHYRELDDIVGEALEYADEETLVLVLSDHGFTSFRREVDLNACLRDLGHLTPRTGSDPAVEPGDLLTGIDWRRTRAYAFGLAGIYLNLRGREREGIVGDGSEAESLKAEICRQLSGLRDEERDAVAVHRVLAREDVYSGPYVEAAPDLLVHCAPGYRVSSVTALGGVAETHFSDNRKRWSGDHVVDPALVPGVLFSSQPLRAKTSPDLVDLAPTILEALGVPAGPAMEGESLL